jgi:hypothetical protein
MNTTYSVRSKSIKIVNCAYAKTGDCDSWAVSLQCNVQPGKNDRVLQG